MRIVLMGNAGAGKTALAKALVDLQPAPRLSLDEVSFSEGTERRAVSESWDQSQTFVAGNAHRVVEDCCSTLIEPLLPYCDVLVFLNPGVETCVAHCYSRLWEKEKFGSARLLGSRVRVESRRVWLARTPKAVRFVSGSKVRVFLGEP